MIKGVYDFKDKHLGRINCSGARLRTFTNKHYLAWHFPTPYVDRSDFYYCVGYDSDGLEAEVRLLVPVESIPNYREVYYYPTLRRNKFAKFMIEKDDLLQFNHPG